VGTFFGLNIEKFAEYTFPALLTLVWGIGIALLAFDVFVYPESPAGKVALGIAIAYVLFIVELIIMGMDAYYIHRTSKFSGILLIAYLLLIIISFCFFLFAYRDCSIYKSSTPFILFTILIISIPKFLSCDVSRNPHHILEPYKKSVFKEKSI